MKIAILTLWLHSNYGGILQAYALMRVLKQLGHDPYFVNNQYGMKRNGFLACLIYAGRAVRKYLLGRKDVEIFRERRRRRVYGTVCRNIRRFIEDNISPRTDSIYTGFDQRRLQKRYGFDAYVVGSDQVWRPAYTGGHIEYFFLSFLRKTTVKRIAYAASFGTQEWTFTRRKTALCGKLLKKFDAVSVREESAIGLCKSHFGVEAVRVLDPTLLLSAEDYRELLPGVAGFRQGAGLLVYLLDASDSKEKIVARVERFMGTKGIRAGISGSGKDRVAPPVEDWLAGFSSARYVVTDSFHGCVFSILFHVPFLAIGNSSRGLVRFHSLLSLFGLEDRLLDENVPFPDRLLEEPIDWASVDERMQEMRGTSEAFLRNALRVESKPADTSSCGAGKPNSGVDNMSRR